MGYHLQPLALKKFCENASEEKSIEQTVCAFKNDIIIHMKWQ